MDTGMEFSRLVAIELSAAAKRAGKTQRALAAAAGISPGQMSYYIAGTKGSMTLATLSRACYWLGVPPAVIVDRAHSALRQMHDGSLDAHAGSTTRRAETVGGAPLRAAQDDRMADVSDEREKSSTGP